MTEPILSVRDLKVHFPVRTGGVLIGEYTPLKAVDGISFNLLPGETLGIVGESRNYSEFHFFSKFVLTGLMLLGRLEVFVLLVLFVPRFWRSQ